MVSTASLKYIRRLTFKVFKVSEAFLKCPRRHSLILQEKALRKDSQVASAVLETLRPEERKMLYLKKYFQMHGQNMSRNIYYGINWKRELLRTISKDNNEIQVSRTSFL